MLFPMISMSFMEFSTHAGSRTAGPLARERRRMRVGSKLMPVVDVVVIHSAPNPRRRTAGGYHGDRDRANGNASKLSVRQEITSHFAAAQGLMV